MGESQDIPVMPLNTMSHRGDFDLPSFAEKSDFVRLWFPLGGSHGCFHGPESGTEEVLLPVRRFAELVRQCRKIFVSARLAFTPELRALLTENCSMGFIIFQFEAKALTCIEIFKTSESVKYARKRLRTKQRLTNSSKDVYDFGLGDGTKYCHYFFPEK